MAISWGGFVNHLRVGIEVWTDAYNTYTPSINVYVAYYVQCDASWNFNDSQTLNLGGNAGGSFTFQNTLGANQSIKVTTYTVANQGQNYNGGPTYTFSGSLAGVYLGSGPSHSVSFTLPARPKRAPSAPGQPTMTAIGSSTASASWTGATDNGGAGIDNYTLHVATDSGFANIVQDLAANSLSRSISGLAPGKAYYIRAFAHNAIGWSAASPTRGFSTDIRAASAPGGPAFSGVGATSFTAAWSDSSDYGGSTPTGYRLQVATSSAFSTIVSDTTANNRSRSVSGLSPGDTYYARVATVNAAGTSSWSSVTSVTTDIRVTSAPGTPTFSSVTATGFTASWSAPSDDGGSTPTSYRLQVATDSAFSSLVSDSSANNRSRAVSGLTPGKSYYARVLAVNGAGSSAWSSTASTTTAIRLATAPGAPIWADVTATTGTLAWGDSSDYGGSSPTGYRLQLASDASFATVVYDNTALNRTRGVTGLAPGKTYYARAATITAAGQSPWSGSTPTTTAAFGTSGIGVSAVGPDTATVSWAAPAGATPIGYQVQYSTDAGFATGVQTITSATWGTSQLLTGLAPATTYYVRVRSNTASGYGDWSAAESFQTLSGAKVRVGGQWVEGVAYVRQGGQWVIAKVYKAQGGSWVL